jgi:hypothetical protein
MCLASHLASHRAGNQLDGTSQSEILRSMLGTARCLLARAACDARGRRRPPAGRALLASCLLALAAWLADGWAVTLQLAILAYTPPKLPATG